MDHEGSLNTLITGGLGQDGSLLAKKLLGQGKRVTLLDYRPDFARSWRLRALGLDGDPNLTVVQIGSRDLDAFNNLLERTSFESFYLFGGISKTLDSIANAETTIQTNYHAVADQLASIYRSHDPNTRVFLAGSSEVFTQDGLLKSESSHVMHSNPYGQSKAMLLAEADDYVSRGYAVVTGILFPHESELRDPSFAVPKISSGFVRILQNKDAPPLELGGALASRDWSSAREVITSASMIMESDFRGRVVIGSGRGRSILEVCKLAWEQLTGVSAEFDKGSNMLYSNEQGRALARFDDPRFEKTNSIGSRADTRLMDSMGTSGISTDGFEFAVKSMIEFYKKVGGSLDS